MRERVLDEMVVGEVLVVEAPELDLRDSRALAISCSWG